jgi:hypothetical protein
MRLAGYGSWVTAAGARMSTTETHDSPTAAPTGGAEQPKPWIGQGTSRNSSRRGITLERLTGAATAGRRLHISVNDVPGYTSARFA